MYVLPPAFIPLVFSKFLVKHVKSIQSSYSSGAMFDGDFLVATVLIMLDNIPHWCPIMKDLIMDVSVDQALKVLPLLHLTFWLVRDVCCTDKGSLPQSVKHW